MKEKEENKLNYNKIKLLIKEINNSKLKIELDEKDINEKLSKKKVKLNNM